MRAVRSRPGLSSAGASLLPLLDAQQRGFNARDVEEEFVFADTQAWYFARKGLGLEPFGRNAQTRGTIEKASQITDSMVGSFTPVQLSL